MTPQPPKPVFDQTFAPPWDYNPSRWRERLIVVALGSAAFGISCYLAAFRWGLVETVWDPVFGQQSEQVLTSEISDLMHQLFGVPAAALGAMASLSEVLLALAGSTVRWRSRPWLVFLFGADVLLLGVVSAALVVFQGVAVESWCLPCLVTAMISLSLIVFGYPEMWSSFLFLRRVWSETKTVSVVANALWGNGTANVLAVYENYLREHAHRADQQQEEHNVAATH